MQEKYPNISTYAYTFLNPVKYIDPDGMEGQQSRDNYSNRRTTVSGAVLGWLIPPARPRTPLQYMQRDQVHIQFAQISLDMLGLVPGVGEPFDLINGGIYLLRGQGTEATLSFAAMIPVAGWAASGTKWGRAVLKFSDNAFHSASGLVFKFGSKHGNRLSHVMAHSVDDLSKAYHGVFTAGDNVIGVLDDAWSMAKKGGGNVTKATEGGRDIYHVTMNKIIGYEGGKKGSKEALNTIRIVVNEGTSEIITAFPSKIK